VVSIEIEIDLECSLAPSSIDNSNSYELSGSSKQAGKFRVNSEWGEI